MIFFVKSNKSVHTYHFMVSGIKGFTAKVTTRSPVKRKSTDNSSQIKPQSPFVKNISEPINLPSNIQNVDPEVSQMKRRKIHSLGNLILDTYVTPPPPFKTSPLVKSPPKPKAHHASYNSCPVESPNAAPEVNMVPHASALNNISFDSTFMDPSDLASKGANILHHLAMWMLEESKQKSSQNAENPVSNPEMSKSRRQLPPPPPPNSLVSNPGSKSRRVKGDSLSGDRPDSGFDSKDEDEVKLIQHNPQVSEVISEEAAIRTASSGDTSPELAAGQISRQAPIRQPVLRKRRLHH